MARRQFTSAFPDVTILRNITRPFELEGGGAPSVALVAVPGAKRGDLAFVSVTGPGFEPSEMAISASATPGTVAVTLVGFGDPVTLNLTLTVVTLSVGD